MAQRSIGSLDHWAIEGSTRGCIDRRTVRLEAPFNGDDRVVHSGRHIAHVDLAFTLERSGPDHRVLGDLVPLLNRVRQRGKGRLGTPGGSRPYRGHQREPDEPSHHPCT